VIFACSQRQSENDRANENRGGETPLIPGVLTSQIASPPLVNETTFSHEFAPRQFITRGRNKIFYQGVHTHYIYIYTYIYTRNNTLSLALAYIGSREESTSARSEIESG